MKTAQKMKLAPRISHQSINQPLEPKKLQSFIARSWKRIAPTWPLKNLIAVNPLAGFEDLTFEDGMRQGQAYFQQKELLCSMHDVNRQTIKWLQVFFDQGQATIKMPLRQLGLFACVFELLKYDGQLKQQSAKTWAWLKKLPNDPKNVISECLLFLGIPHDKQEQFLTLQLTTLSGWAAYIKYRTDWADAEDAQNLHPVTQTDYLALRLVLTCLLWPEAKKLLEWYKAALKSADVDKAIKEIGQAEDDYRRNLLSRITHMDDAEQKRSMAQLVFCIDVRSEPFRRALESQGNYETLGFAGFFGVPVSIENKITGETHASCPVLLKPTHHITEAPSCNHAACQKTHERNSGLKKLYQSLKYTFATPFTLVEALGPFSGILMALRSFFPNAYVALKQKGEFVVDFVPQIESIPLDQQISFASGALRMMGLTQNFSPLVVFCGHGSETQNNAYATALDCGACGGHHGAPNARILASILNNRQVVQELWKMGIKIPEDTYFAAAEHNTTTDEVTLYTHGIPAGHSSYLISLRQDLEKAKAKNSSWRANQLDKTVAQPEAADHTSLRAKDWAQVRPEWGLARNAAFIVGPRALTQKLDLEGRSFLHSYDWNKDEDGSALTVILTAPMVVAQWINAQYLFSTLDNVAYGGGSKISKNITGKIGIMQGNASDLMHGLPLQSVYKDDREAYHQPLRLMTIVYAPRHMIDRIIASQDVLKKLFGHGWVHLVCIEPKTGEKFILNKDFSWQRQL